MDSDQKQIHRRSAIFEMYFHAGKIVIYLSVKTLWVRGVQVEVLRVTSSMCYECAVQIYLEIKCMTNKLMT